MAVASPAMAGPLAYLQEQQRWRLIEVVFWLSTLLPFVVTPDYLVLASQIAITALFALSLDLILGYAGIVTLGHDAFFGVGAYTVGILAVHAGWAEPLTGLIAAGMLAGLLGIVTGLVILRTHGLTLLMLTLAVVFMLYEAANKATHITGGADGLQAFAIDPILGLFRFDLFGRTAYLYTLAVLFVAWAFVRLLVHSPFGRSLTGVRENVTRMHAIGAPVRRRLVTAYAISAALAGIAGGLLAQTTQFVGLNTITFERSGEILIMLILGGVGRLYGAFIGPPLFMIAQDTLAKNEPVFWLFYIGLLLVLVVMFARGGVLGLIDTLWARLVRRRR